MDADIYYDEMGKDMRVEPIPADMVDLANEYREKLLDAVSMFDDSIMEDYLEGKEIAQDRIRKAIRQATIANEMVPVTCGTSYRNKGVQKLLDAIVDYMPAPNDVPAIKGTNPKTDEEEDRHPRDDEPFSALAFKIMTDPYVGRLSFFRVYSGHLTTGSSVLNSVKNQKERMGRILQMHANHREDIEEVWAGDIAAAVGLKNTTTGDTLCDEKAPVILESMDFPEPVIRVAIEPKTKAGQEKMGLALVKLAEEDPTFKTYTDEETGQTIIAGMSRSPWSPTSPARAMSLSTRWWAVPSPRNSSPLSTPVSRVPCSPALSPASLWWTSRSLCTTVLITKWTPPKWRSRSPAPWPSRRLCARQIPSCWSPS